MQVLINYAPTIIDQYGKERAGSSYLPTAEYYLKKAGYTAAATSRTMTKQELVKLCKAANCQAVLINNSETLANLVPTPSGKKKPSISAWRGSRIDLDEGFKAIVIAPLDQVHSVKEGSFLLETDINKLKKINYPAVNFQYELLDDPRKFSKWLKWANASWLMAVDIETDQHGMKKNEKSTSRVPCFNTITMDIAGLGETWITCVAFTIVTNAGEYRTAVLPLVNANGVDYWELDEDYAAALEFLRNMMATTPTKVFHNGIYDCYHLIRYRAWPKNWTLDSMGLFHAWLSELGKKLHEVSSICLYDHYYWKDLADSSHKAKDMETYWYYNGKDSWNTARIIIHMLTNCPEYTFVNYKKKFREVYPSLYGAFEGWKMNLATRDRLKAEALVELTEAKNRLRTIADDPDFNPSSPKQVEELLYETMGAQKPTRGKSKGKTDKKSRAFVASQHPILTRVVELLNQFSLKQKAYSTYYSFLVWNERLLFSLDPFGTETGRDSSRGSAAWVGTQIQNQPPYAKEMYEPDDGYIGFELDYSKSEAVCSAYLSGCDNLIKALCFPELDKKGEKKDFYKQLGVLFFGMIYEEVTKDFRNKVLKKINHGTNYMMQAATFIDNLDDINVLYFAAELLDIKLIAGTARAIPETNKRVYDEDGKQVLTMLQFAATLLESYHTPFPEVKEWWAKLWDEVDRTGYIVGPTGHTRRFFGDINRDHSIKRSAVAHQPQGLSAELLNRGFWKAYLLMHKLPPDVLRIKTQIHDSINGQVKIEYARIVIPYLKELIKARERINGRDMVIEVDCEVYHTNWKEKQSWKDFSETTLTMLESQRQPIFHIDGLQLV